MAVDIGDRVVVDAIGPMGKSLVQVVDGTRMHGVAGGVGPGGALDQAGV